MELVLVRNKGTQVLLLLLFCIVPFTGGLNKNFGFIIIPPWLVDVSSYSRWGILFLLLVSFVLRFESYNRSLTSVGLLYSFFYFILCCYCCFTFSSEIIRYLPLFVLSFSMPLLVANEICSEKKGVLTLKNLNICIYIIFLVGIFVNFSSFSMNYRFKGLFNNPNSSAMVSTIWLAILLIDRNNKFNPLFVLLIFISIILSGSRGGLVSALVVVIFSLNRKILTRILIYLGILITIATYWIELDFSLFSRAFMIANAVSDSGRGEIWGLAFDALKENYFGYGMNAHDSLLKKSNTHNCYLRFAVDIGIPLTILLIVNYSVMVFCLLGKLKFVPKSLVGLVVAFALVNFGEDYYTGLGSPVLFYVFFCMGLVTYFLKRQLPVPQQRLKTP